MALDVGPLPDDLAGIIQFDLKTPAGEAEITANVASTLALGLPRFDDDVQLLRVIASGPSAKQAPLDGPTLALNGALKLFTQRGLSPTYWAACDPQELVCEFLTGELPRETIYLVASKCHPAVFERLKGYDVRPWHVSDFVGWEERPVPCGTSITTCAISLALRLGFPRQEVWGWDCCFGADGEDHALPQTHDYPEILDVEIEGKHFKTTRSWALEAFDLGNKVWPIHRWLGLDIKVMGDGMVRAFLAGSKAELA